MPAESVGCDTWQADAGAAEVPLAVERRQVLQLADEHSATIEPIYRESVSEQLDS